HKVHITYNGPSMATVKLDPSEQQGGNRDYILRYRLDGNQIQSGLLLYEGERENFFLFMMQPPERVTKQEIPGREYIFIVDVSGSMNGFPLEISKQLLKNLIGYLLPTDRFNVLLFSGGSSLMAGTSLPATSENINRALQMIDRQQGGGGTEILPAFRRALALPKPDGFSRTVVIATDGYVTVEEEVFDLIRKNLGEANVFSFGVGTSVNRHLIQGMARVGMGEPFIITRPEEAPSKAERLRTLIQSPVITQVKINFQDFTPYDVEPLSIPDVLAERPVIVFGKWRGQPLGKIILSGISGKGPYREVTDIHSAKPMKSNSAIRYLWARHRIALLSDYNMLRSNDQRIKEVTDLGLAYNLMTAYTSFVAVDTEVRNQNGQVTTVKQPLPLPQGVSDYAVGGVLASQSFAPRMAKQLSAALEEKPAQDLQPGKKEAEKGSVQVETLTVSEGLSKEAILKIAQKNIRDIETCFLGSGLQVKLRIQLTIQPNGKIKTVKILSSPFHAQSSEQCILEGIKKWIFPSFPESREGKVTISFIFGTN
ncbi:MAG: AgmX/PglI C-terminal domain-containing protein, partial [Candidatus Zixiibacteriota bacterium]